MADPGVSTQNFLRLLLGGAQQGADVFQQRQTQQQAQVPDLYMALQRMMQHKQERQEDVAFRREGRNLDIEQNANVNRRADEALDLQKRAAGRQEYYDSQQALSAHTARIRQLQEETERDLSLTKLAEKYPELGPVVDMHRSGMSGGVIGDVLRGMYESQTEADRAGGDKTDKIASMTEKLMKTFLESGLPGIPKDTMVTPEMFFQKAQEIARKMYGGGLSSGSLDDLSIEELDGLIAEMEAQLKGNAK